jgi:hypothetical protein
MLSHCRPELWLHSKTEAVVFTRWAWLRAFLIDTVGIADERVGQAAEIEQTVPIGIVAREAGQRASMLRPARHRIGRGSFGRGRLSHIWSLAPSIAAGDDAIDGSQ